MTMRLRALGVDDLPVLAGWLGAPHVARWWREPSDLASVTARYGPLAAGVEPTEGLIVELDCRPVGFVQRYLLRDDPQWAATVAVGVGELEAASIDYLIGEERLTGRGLGGRMVALVAADSWDRHRTIDAIVVDVRAEHRASWRALERAGFERVWSGTLASEDPSDDGPAHLYLQRRPDP